jgi:iron(III) transport system ATP-binding protein
MSNPVWNLSGVTLAGRERPRLDDVSLEISAGVTAVMGSSGAGKSSLFGLLADFEKPDAGRVQFVVPDSSTELPLYWSPQDHGLWPHLTVAQHIDFVLSSKATLERSAIQWLEQFSLCDLHDSLPESLSQGERSRLAMTRALASQASVLILDEPLVHVDPMLAHRCWQIAGEHLQHRCSAAVFTTHDPDAVLKYAQHVICLDKGAVTFCGSVETLYFDPPSKELAWLLGPCNWLDDQAFRSDAGLDLAGRDSCCVRPSQLELRQDSSGRFVVASILRAAFVNELQLRSLDSESVIDIFVSHLNADIAVGDSVRLAVHKAVPKPTDPAED